MDTAIISHQPVSEILKLTLYEFFLLREYLEGTRKPKNNGSRKPGNQI